MKILLIQPFADESNTNYPPIGLLYLASWLRKTSDHQIALIDLRVKKEDINSRLQWIKEWEPDIAGITGMSIEWTGMREIATVLVKELPKPPLLVAGGPHATIFEELVLRKTPVRYIVRGEGEHVFAEIVRRTECGEDCHDLKGISYLRNEEVIRNSDADPINELDLIPFPAYDLLDLEDYFRNPHFHTNLNKYNRAFPLVTSRGCPFHCQFCFHSMGHIYRSRSPENVLAEVDLMVKTYGIQEIQIEDDTFNFDPERAKSILQAIIDRNYRLAISFPNGIRADIIDEELMDLFIRSGVYRIHYGIETASERIQKLIHKPLNLKKLSSVIDWTNQANISSHGFFMIGFPSETEDEIEETIGYAVRSNLATANFSLVKLFPGTPLGKQYLSKEKQSFNDDFAFSYDSTETNFSRVSNEKLKRLQQSAMVRFYFRPKRIWRIFRTSPNKRNLFFRNVFSTLALIFRGKTKY